MSESLEIRIVCIMYPKTTYLCTLPYLAHYYGYPFAQVRAAMVRLQRDGLIEKWRVSRNTKANDYFYRGQKTATLYQLTNEGEKLSGTL